MAVNVYDQPQLQNPAIHYDKPTWGQGQYKKAGWNVEQWAFDTCGLVGLSQMHAGLEETNYPELLLTEIGVTYNKQNQGNFIFAITSIQLRQKKGRLAMLLNHPGTKIIHWYKNNAHGPNLIFICMHHMFKDEIDRPKLTNNVDNYRKRLKVNYGIFSLDPA